MSYPRFFISSGLSDDGFVTFTGESANHISRSLRMRQGEIVIGCDEDGNEYECELFAFTPDTVKGKVVSVRKNESELPVNVRIFQCCPKSDKTELIIQKGVELGMTSFVPVLSDRCVARYDSKDAEKKRMRWQKISLEAAKQSGRGKVPEIGSMTDFQSAVFECAKSDICFVCYENENGKTLKNILESNKEVFSASDGKKTVSFIVGPEGGLSEKEISLCLQNGIPSIGLGKRILRTETAGLFVLSCISYFCEL